MAEWAVSNKYKKGEVQRHFLFKLVEIFQYDRSHHYLKFQNWRGKYLHDFMISENVSYKH